MTAHLAIVGQLQVPDSVMRHRFAREALGCATIMRKNYDEGDSQEQVVGTANNGIVELYGWAPNVAAHADRTGYIYLATINDGESSLGALNSRTLHPGAIPDSVRLTKGRVVRLDDHCPHWTFDYQTRVCVFLGSFRKPADDEAVILLQAAVDALAAGSYYDAPRVSGGFRVLLPDECLVPDDAFTACKPMLLADAISNNAYFEPCSHCVKPAVRLDHHWPFDASNNRCFDHIREK